MLENPGEEDSGPITERADWGAAFRGAGLTDTPTRFQRRRMADIETEELIAELARRGHDTSIMQ